MVLERWRANTQIDGTLRLPDGRTIPVIVSLDLGPIKTIPADPTTQPNKALSWLNTVNSGLGSLTPRQPARTFAGLERVLGTLLDLEYDFPA
jgi:hypothetical protein